MGHHWSHWVNCVRYSVVQRSNSMRYGVVGDDGHWMGNMWGSMNCVVRDHRGGMDSMVNSMVGNHRSCMDSMVGHGVNCVRYGMGDWSNSMMSSVVERSHSMSDRVGSSMGMRDGCRDRMVRSGVDSVVSHWVGGVDGVTGGDGFGKEGVQQRVGVQSVERGSFSTVDLQI